MKPFVFINVAVTADGKLDTFERKGANISSAMDKVRVQTLRASADAIMVGGNTLLSENPKLTVKIAQLREERKARGLSENPIKVGVVTKAEINLDGDFMTAGHARKVIFTTSMTSDVQVIALTNQGAEVYVLGEKRVNLFKALDILYELGVRRLMVEGGGSINFELLRIGLVDELFVYQSSKIFGGYSAPTLADGAGFTESTALQLNLVEVQKFGEDGGILIHYRLSN